MTDRISEFMKETGVGFPEAVEALAGDGLGFGSWMVAWSPDRGSVKVGPWPDRTRWSDSFECTNGCCSAPHTEGSVEDRVIRMFALFHEIVVRDGIDPGAAHREFAKIGEFRRRVAGDTLEGAG